MAAAAPTAADGGAKTQVEEERKRKLAAVNHVRHGGRVIHLIAAARVGSSIWGPRMHFGHALIRILHSACGVLSRADMILMKSHLISVLPPDGIRGPGRRNGPWVHLPQQPGRMRFYFIE